MQKYAVLAALASAVSSSSIPTYYRSAEFPCFKWDATTGAYVMGSYVSAFGNAASKKDAKGDKYHYAFDVTLEGFSTSAKKTYYCDQVVMSATAVEWTVSTTDTASTTPMLLAYYSTWTITDHTTSYSCNGTYASKAVSTMATASMYLSDSMFCAYDLYFEYDNGLSSTATAITATKQVVTIYTDNSIVAAASTFVAAGVAAMLF